MLKKTPESPLNSKEIKSVNFKGDQSWIFPRRTDAEAEAPVFWSSDANTDSLEKSLMLGKIEGRRRRGHQRMKWLDGITNASMNLGKLWEMVRSGGPGVSELDMTGWLNDNSNKPYLPGNELTFRDSYFPSADSFHLWPKSNLPNSQPIKSRPVLFLYFILVSALGPQNML